MAWIFLACRDYGVCPSFIPLLIQEISFIQDLPIRMTKKEKAAEIQRLLDHYHPEVPIPLQHQDPYTLLVAVLLSAQCTDELVNQITPSMFALADNPGTWQSNR